MINFFKRKTFIEKFPEIRIKLAFTESNGMKNYCMEDSDNLLAGRAFHALNFYNELSMKCTKEFLIGHTESVDKLLTDPKRIDLPKIGLLNNQLKERLELIIDSLTPYKVASVVYFDETENPYSFDYKYAFEKIERWKKEKVSDFFLTTPLKDLIPSLLWSEENLESYMKIQKEVDQEHLKTILEVLSGGLSESQKNSEWYKTLKLQKSLI
jgi:hypothetical protein